MSASHLASISLLTIVSLPFLLDLAGTFVFALSGAVAGVRHKLDLFGIHVLSFVAANIGGIARDVLIGAVPPAAVDDWRYVAVSVAAGLLTFFPSQVMVRRAPAQLFDAAGLALFAVTGAHKALTVGLHPVTATLLGILTAIGGGIARDVLLSEIPTVLRAELYAVAALAGPAVVIAPDVHLPSDLATLVGALLCFALRVLAIRNRWQLLIARIER